MDTVPKYFYDTCSLLHFSNQIFSNTDKFVISEITLRELENIKTSAHKDDETKYQARQVINQLIQNQDMYDVILMTDEIFNRMEVMELEDTNDNRIIMSATYYYQDVSEIIFVTDDLCLYMIAKNITPVPVKLGSEVFENNKNIYKGYKEVVLSNEELADLYGHLDNNKYNCLINEYLLIKNSDNEIIDKRKWSGKEYEELSYNKQIKSRAFGSLRPLDEYQECAFDSVCNNDITVLTGRAGAGKTTIPLNYFAKNIESQKIKKLYIIYHFEPLKGARTLGFEKGDHLSKILNTGSLANLLASKFGDITEVTRMIEDQKLEIIPTANIRGVEFGSEDAVFVTECQDIDTYTLKTIIQRCKDGCKQIYEGDILEQSDLTNRSIGMTRMIDVFKGHPKFGIVKLKNNYRSELCSLADEM